MNKTVGSALLITGTCIGAGMLALPVSTASSGFVFSSVIILLCWALMCYTGLLTLEANLCVPAESNFISMAKATLGQWGELSAWLTYLLLLYSLMAAYLTAGGGIMDEAVSAISTVRVADWVGPIPWALIAGVLVYIGVRSVDLFNRLLMFGLIATYVLLVSAASPHVVGHLLLGGHSTFLFAALPIIVASFGYHVIIPSLRVYLQGQVHKLINVIIIGSFIPFLVYLCWDLVIFGTIPAHGAHGLEAIFRSGKPATEVAHSLAAIVQSPWVVDAAELFAFFAIASSFLGIATALFDFIADAFGITKSPKGRILILVIMFLPPLCYAQLYPKGFIFALSYAGVFVAILHGILPALMAWAGRAKGLASYQTPGGKTGLIAVVLLSVVIIFAQIGLNLHWIQDV